MSSNSVKVRTQPRDLNDVRIFVAIAGAPTLSAAARKLRVPTSTVSRSLTRLEQQLGITLVQRGARGLALTDVGREYLNTCRRTLRTLHEGEDWIETQRVNPSGLLRVACPVTFAREVLAPLLKAFLDRFPGLIMHIETFSSGFDYSPSDEIDVFFKIRAPRDSARRIRCYPGNAMGLFASKEYLKLQKPPASPEELVEHRCIGEGIWKLTRDKASCTPDLSFLVETPDPHIALTLVLKSLGIAVLPLWMAKWPEIREEIVAVLPAWEVEMNSLCALFFGPAAQTPKVQALLDFLDEYIGTTKDPRLRQKWTAELFPTIRGSRSK